MSKYRSVPVLVVPPVERGRSTFKDMRWFAVLDSDVILFGTLATVEQELDRHLDGSAPDLSIVQKLNRMRCDDDVFECIVLSSRKQDEPVDSHHLI